MKRTTVVLLLILLLGVIPVAAQPADQTARLRFAHYVTDIAEVDVYINGELAVEALAFRRASPHLELTADMVEVVFVPAGQPLEASGLLTTNIEMEPNNDHTLAMIGQQDDGSLQGLVIDELAIVGTVRDLQLPASYAILLHGISNGPNIDFSMDGETLIRNLTFGEYAVITVTVEPHDILVTFSDEPDQVLFRNDGETPPSSDLLLLTVMIGDYPDNLAVSGAVSRLPDRSVLDFLASYSADDGTGFSTLLNALETADLTEILMQEGAYTLFAPTDAAFAALPQETLDLLFAYPDALRSILLGHVVDEVFTTRGLSGSLTLVSREGAPVVVSLNADGNLTVNDNAILLFGGFPVVTNGNVIGIDRILIPEPRVVGR